MGKFILKTILRILLYCYEHPDIAKALEELKSK
jgi:hypothetical protein